MKKQIRKEKKQETSIFLEIKKLTKDAYPPEYIMESDVGLDLRANETVSLMPMEQKAIKTGLAIKIPDGHVGLIRDRAGIVNKMDVHTAAGTFDPAYRGEISIVVVNFGEKEIEIEKGMRIAQIIILPITKVKVKLVNSLLETKRGSKGFGSTGIKEKIENINKLSDSLK
jgi:dUTP pyrophosphatase